MREVLLDSFNGRAIEARSGAPDQAKFPTGGLPILPEKLNSSMKLTDYKGRLIFFMAAQHKIEDRL